ncbi:MAG: methylaspartate ammonia-lyase [Actinobacteria bacterium]|nr:methylaspartate ammonia-lyase [Actinomycetota bacterium]
MKIKKVVASKGFAGFYYDDQAAIKSHAKHDGFAYSGEPITPGFSTIRIAGESISVMLVLDEGRIAYGDCVAVQYSGAAGRDALFLADDYLPIINEKIAPLMVEREIENFKNMAEELDNLKVDGERLHTALRYGITQAILNAVSRKKHITMAEVICQEYGIEIQGKPVPIFAQSGDDRYNNADKMIIKGIQVLPHGLINNVEEKLGRRGEKLMDYLSWLRTRVVQLGKPDYNPIFHLDVYGTFGQAFNNDMETIAKYIMNLERISQPYHLRIEGPVDAGSKEGQIKSMRELRTELKKIGSKTEIIADEWCNTFEDIKDFVHGEAADMIQIKAPDLGGINNTIEAILFCKKHGVGAYLGGSCNETDRSARICAHIALATGPCQILAKPGMGVDEAVMLINNEMNRTLTLIKNR